MDQHAALIRLVAGSPRGVDDDDVLSRLVHSGAVGLPGIPSRPLHNKWASCSGAKTCMCPLSSPTSLLNIPPTLSAFCPDRDCGPGEPSSSRWPIWEQELLPRCRSQESPVTTPKLRTQRTMGMLILRGHGCFIPTAKCTYLSE